MAQRQFRLVDRKQDSPIWAPAQFNVAATRAAANALFNNSTPDAYVTGATVGVYGVSSAEMSDELESSEQSRVTAAGWVVRKEFGSRVQYETLVATKNISSDAPGGTDDSILPE